MDLEIIMTAAQKLRQQGMQQGVQQGMQQGIITKAREVAKNMLRLHLDIDTVEQATKLSKKEIQELMQEANNNPN